MTIILRINNFDQLPDGGPVQYRTVRRSFDIGREQNLDWTLPDPNRVISGRHCEVRYESGGYWLFDVSRNGTFLNNAGARMKSPHRLDNGDMLQIGHYLISVTIQDAAFQDVNDEPPSHGNAVTDGIWDFGGPGPAPVDESSTRPEQECGQRAADFPERHADQSDIRQQPVTPAETPFWQPAATPPSQYGFPDDFKPRQSSFSEPPVDAAPPSRPSPVPLFPATPEGFPQPPPGIRPIAPPEPAMQQPVPRQAFMPPSLSAIQAGQQASSTSMLRALEAGAGVAPGTFDQRNPDEVAHEIGAVLKIALEQLAVLLKARAAAKGMTRSAKRTMIGADQNNPLKFIPATAEIIEVMFARRRPGYLDARSSVEEAFADLKSHELATFAAMQKALGRLLDGLSPQSIETKLPSSAFLSKKTRAWDMFVERWDSKSEPYENGMLDVFLAYFAEAYDEAARKR